MAKRVLVLPGDGAGPEIASCMLDVMNAVCDDLIVVRGDIGVDAHFKTDYYLPPETIEAAMDSDAIISSGVFRKPDELMYRDPIKVLKKQLGLHTSACEFRPLTAKKSAKNIDLILLSGNPDYTSNITEMETLDGVSAERFFSAGSYRKLFSTAARIASYRNRKKITCAHQADVFPAMDSMFVRLFKEELAKSGLNLEIEDADTLIEKLCSDPSVYDVVVCTEMCGSSVRSLASGLLNKTGASPLCSISETHGIFEPMHPPEYGSSAGFDPTSAILAGAMAMDFMGMPSEGDRIRAAVSEACLSGTAESRARTFTDTVCRIAADSEGQH